MLRSSASRKHGSRSERPRWHRIRLRLRHLRRHRIRAPAPAPADDLADAAAKLGAALYRAVMCSRPGLTLLGGPTSSGPGELSIAMLTTLPVTDYEVIELGLAPRDDVPRFAQVLTVALASGAPVRVVNTHLTHRFTSPVQLRRLRRCLRAGAARSRHVPTMIVGDLNMPRSCRRAVGRVSPHRARQNLACAAAAGSARSHPGQPGH